MEYIKAKTIITKNKSTSWFGEDYNMNIYRGCCHGCIYCDSRSDCYHVENFDAVKVKENALQIIRDDLRRKVKKGVIGTGSMSDPYNPLENQLCLTRNALQLVSAYGFGIGIATKSHNIVRDIDILQEIKVHSPVIIKITVTTFDDALCRIIEPNVSETSKRFEAIKMLSDNDIYTGVLMMPILPYINDTEENILNIVENAYKSGAKFIYPAFGLTLRTGQREYFYNKLDEHFKELSKVYQKQYGTRYSAGSKKAKELYAVFKEKCDSLGILYDMKYIIRSYKMGYRSSQLSFFD